MIVVPILLFLATAFTIAVFLIGIEDIRLLIENPPELVQIHVDLNDISTARSITTIDELLQEDVTVHLLETGEHILVLSEEISQDFETFMSTFGSGSFELTFLPHQPEGIAEMSSMFFIVAILVLGLLTNFALRMFVLNNIKSSIVELEAGVREVSDGNLTYQIQERKGNEFDALYERFNEMATRLLEMTQQRQADENNRKELIAGISHDLRTPLTSIKAYIEGMKKGVATTPEMQEKYMDTIGEKADDMEYIINQLFLFSKMDLGEFPFQLETVDICMELEKMAAKFTDEYMKNDVSITYAKDVEHLFACIDVVQFRNVIGNIVNNSIKYGKQADGKIEISCQEQNNHAIITIKDNGPGVASEILTKMFDIFYRGDASRNNAIKGSGLGLAISAKIIERLNGTISAGSSPDDGLMTTITLPIAKGGAK